MRWRSSYNLVAVINRTGCIISIDWLFHVCNELLFVSSVHLDTAIETASNRQKVG